MAKNWTSACYFGYENLIMTKTRFIFSGAATCLLFIWHITFFAACVAISGYAEEKNLHSVICIPVQPVSKSRKYEDSTTNKEKHDFRFWQLARLHWIPHKWNVILLLSKKPEMAVEHFSFKSLMKICFFRNLSTL